MHTKLHFKIFGANDPSDLEIIKENLKSQESVKKIMVHLAKDFTGVELEVEEDKISSQQIIDIIKISGDFKVSEQVDTQAKPKTAAPKVANIQVSEMVSVNNGDSIFSTISPKASFIWGIVCGFSIMSVIFTILFGYFLFNSSPIKLFGEKDSVNTAIKQAVPGAPKAPVPTPQNGGVVQIQKFDITKNDRVRGNFNAPVTLVEYSDFECPYSGRAYPTYKKILSDYPDKVRLVYKYFPLSFHPNAQKAAEAAECAAEQGKFWEYHDKLFESQTTGFSLENFKQWADDLSLNTKKFNDCLDSGKYTSQVQTEVADGQNRGVGGTPTTFINGQLVSGAVPYESFKSIIDQELTNK